jgi:alpha-beta hydrolase superfamily lysophospholipase
VTPIYLRSGDHSIAAIYEAATGAARDTAVLIVPPFGWDDQTSYRPRRDWSVALAAAGFANLRIDLPGTGDSSGDVRDEGLAAAWATAVDSAAAWLRGAGAARVAAIALGIGGLVTLKAIANGTSVDDLVLWGMPANGRLFVREFKAFGRLEQSQTGEASADTPENELRAGGHVLTPALIAELSELDALALLEASGPRRALAIGRDGSGPETDFVDALRSRGADVRTDPGRGWGAALARPQSISPTRLFQTVNEWLAAGAAFAVCAIEPAGTDSTEMGEPGSRIRETAVVFNGAGQQLYAIIAEPVHAPLADLTLVLYNAGAIRRIGPNRMWAEAARRWAAAGVPVLRVDIEGIGDAGGDGSAYRESDDPFYTSSLVDQARAALDLARQHGLPDRFALGGLCSGGYWAFQAALADPRVQSVIMLNPRLLFFDPKSDGQRELRKLRRLFTPSGLRRVRLEKLSLKRAARLGRHLLRRRIGRSPDAAIALEQLSRRGQHVVMGFSGEEPLYEELRSQFTPAGLEGLGVHISNIPYKSHTLKPVKAQEAGHSVIDEGVRRALQHR